MKNFLIIIIIIILGIFTYRAFTPAPSVKEPVEVIESEEETTDTTNTIDTTVGSIIGCYVAGTEKDVYTLTIQHHEANQVIGTLEFDNFQKDSSSGNFIGTYQDGILLGEYSFSSEGMDSVMEVIFKQEGEDFVRGYGEVTNEGTEFVDIGEINYQVNDLSLFEKKACTQE